jgi:hypothetical protein
VKFLRNIIMFHTKFHSLAIITEIKIGDSFCLALFSTSIWLDALVLSEFLDFTIFNWRSHDIFSLGATINSIGDRAWTLDIKNSHY